MSLSKTIFETIDDNINLYIQKYISEVAETYSIDKNELLSIWKKDSGERAITSKVTTVKKLDTQETTTLDPELMKLSKKELSEMCKAKKLPVSGTKNDLIKRLLEGEKQPKIFSKDENIDRTKSKGKTSQPEVIKKLVEKIPTIEIRRNAFGNFEHSETHLVINNTTKKIYGRQNEDGTVSELTPQDIDLCHKYKFLYDIPENLDKKNSNLLDDDEDDELGDDDENVEEEELEEELEDDLEDEDDELVEDDDIEEYYDEE